MEIDPSQFRRASSRADWRFWTGIARAAGGLLAMSMAWPGATVAEQASQDAAPPAGTGLLRRDPEPPASHLSRLFGDFAALERLRREIRAHCDDARAGLNWQADGMEEFADTIKHSLERLSDTQLGQASLVELFELDRRIGFHKTDLDRISNDLTAAAAQLEDDYDRLELELQRWTSARLVARESAAPAELSRRIDDALQTVDELKDLLVPVRDEVLRRLNLVSGSALRIAALRAEIATRRIAVGQQVRTAAGSPLRQATMTRADLVRAKALAAVQFSTRRADVEAYWREQWVPLTTTLLGLFVFSRAALTRAPRLSGRNGGSLPRALEPLLVRDVVNAPILSSLVLGIMGLALLAPKGPAAFYDAINVLLPLAVLLLWYRWRGTFVRTSLIGFVLAFLPVLLWGVLELLPLVDRWVMLFQVVMLGSSLTWDYRRGNWNRGFPEFSPGLIRVLVYLTLLSLLVGLAANALGYIGLARTSIWSMIVLISDLAVFGTSGLVFYVVGAVLVYLPWADRSYLLPRRRKILLGWLRKALVACLGLWVAARLLFNYGLYDPLVAWAEGALQWHVSVGDGSVSLAQGLTAGAILLATWLLMRCLQLVFEEELFPRLRLPLLRIPFAASAFARYLTGLVGVVLAMSALGLDLTKVTLLAGALGVGIGFGLQNIFNNFASGLILLVERPINVGDVIELGQLTGTVRRIGIRSSTIRTPQGAEVILPNAELIAQPLTNWTLSDRLRRMEIDFSLTTPSETVETVIALLEAAARETPDVLVEPPPYALFSGFGDGCLNFRLFAWINRYEDESRIASSVRRAILARFEALGIRGPDPLHEDGAAVGAPSLQEPTGPVAPHCLGNTV